MRLRRPGLAVLDLQPFAGNPIVQTGLSPSLGDNINGPSVIRVPDWVDDPLGRFYLYFAHHEGSFIRLAYSDEVIGPWTIHEPGALHLKQTPFAKAGLQIGDEWLPAHIASPDLHIDHENREIQMYYHGQLDDGAQATALATSSNGLDFDCQKTMLGPPYFRAFRHGGWVYAFAWGGALLRSADGVSAFEPGPNLLAPLMTKERIIRHLAIELEGDQLTLCYSRIGDKPERIFAVKIALAADWQDWRFGNEKEILAPQRSWEGADLPMQTSTIGIARTLENALRDPCIFENYLFYCGGGEQAIGVAEING